MLELKTNWTNSTEPYCLLIQKKCKNLTKFYPNSSLSLPIPNHLIVIMMDNNPNIKETIIAEPVS